VSPQPPQPPQPAQPAQPEIASAPTPQLAESDALELLTHGEIELEGRLLDASNATLRAVITGDGVVARCVYKPVTGERPLWDFPDGTLAGRERAAFLVSQATGWGVVPPTVLRDGPLGPGMCQLWIDEERQETEPLLGFVPVKRVPDGWRRVAAARDERGRPYALAHADDPRLARMAVYDAVVNNADRKGGHIIPTVDSHVYGVDHGVCFNCDEKLRTVLWGWAGEPLPDECVERLEHLAVAVEGGLGDALAEHLTTEEVGVVGMRIHRLLRRRRFPDPPQDWPAIPWPPM
jgi:uncharacterized repeat protein (TIGR03843 family)